MSGTVMSLTGWSRSPSQNEATQATVLRRLRHTVTVLNVEIIANLTAI